MLQRNTPRGSEGQNKLKSYNQSILGCTIAKLPDKLALSNKQSKKCRRIRRSGNRRAGHKKYKKRRLIMQIVIAPQLAVKEKPGFFYTLLLLSHNRSGISP